MVVPLRKLDGDGQLYRRPHEIERRLEELESLDLQALIERCGFPPSHANHVPDECVLHSVRHREKGHTNELLTSLLDRARALLCARDPRTWLEVPGTGRTVGEVASEQFEELVLRDQREYAEQLDFYEVRFAKAAKYLWLTTFGRTETLEAEATHVDGRDVELTLEEERQISDETPFSLPESEDRHFRLTLDRAIDGLSERQQRVCAMLRAGIPIESIDPDVISMASVLGCSGRTVRNELQKIRGALRPVLLEAGYAP